MTDLHHNNKPALSLANVMHRIDRVLKTHFFSKDAAEETRHLIPDSCKKPIYLVLVKVIVLRRDKAEPAENLGGIYTRIKNMQCEEIMIYQYHTFSHRHTYRPLAFEISYYHGARLKLSRS